MQKHNLIFDLDGTLIDVSEKCYKLYSDLLRGSDFKILTKKKYWLYKRKGITEENIVELTCPKEFAKKYIKNRLRKIESLDYLKFDKLITETKDILQKLSEKYSLYLVTMRSCAKTLNKQLTTLDIKKYFKKIVCAKKLSKKQKKLELIKNLRLKHCALLIGDTAEDILIGKTLGFITCAVLYGLREKTILQKCHPEFLIENLKDIKKILNI